MQSILNAMENNPYIFVCAAVFFGLVGRDTLHFSSIGLVGNWIPKNRIDLAKLAKKIANGPNFVPVPFSPIFMWGPIIACLISVIWALENLTWYWALLALILVAAVSPTCSAFLCRWKKCFIMGLVFSGVSIVMAAVCLASFFTS